MSRFLFLLLLASAVTACGDDPAPEAAPAVPTDPAPDGAKPQVPPPEPQPPEPGYQAWVYASDPIGDDGQLQQVTLPATSTPAGHLSNSWVAVSNCLNEEGGPTARQSFGGFTLEIAFCREAATAKGDEAGNYLHIRPPADERDPNDAFAEVMMYYHVNQIHDYFRDRFGFRALDFPLPAIVNVQFKIEPPLPFFMPGPDGWTAFPNAAFFPKEQWNQLASSLGFPTRDADAIIFGQAEADYAYDAHVVYHEYGHAVIGTRRLQNRVADAYGLDESPRGMNEGLADYFAASKSDDPVVGRYGIGKSSPAQVRDVSVPRRCPEDVYAEVHADGKIIGTALWALRARVGAEAADAIAFDALDQFSEATTLEDAGRLIAAEALERGEALGAVAREVLEAHGVLGCVRAKPFAKFEAASSVERLPYPVEGLETAGVPGFDAWVPGYFGFFVEVPAGGAAKLKWNLGAAAGLGGFGGLGGGGGGQPRLGLAVRSAAPVTLDYSGASPVRIEDAFVEPPVVAVPGGGYEQSVIVSGKCVPPEGGRVYLLFVNAERAAASVTGTDVEVLDVAPVETSSTSTSTGALVVRCVEGATGG